MGDKIHTGLFDTNNRPVFEGSLVQTYQSKNGNGKEPFIKLSGEVVYINGSFYVIGQEDKKVSLSIFFNGEPYNRIEVLFK